MDTDSAYLALSGPNFEDLVKEELKEEYYANRDKWLPAEACDVHKQEYAACKLRGDDWRGGECCKQRKAYDRRTPGLFKVEWEGEGIVSLCSKSYYCFGDTDKCSTKGLNRNRMC
mgnify:CR=1 FL=1